MCSAERNCDLKTLRLMKTECSGIGSHTKEALYENLFLRQQDLQLSPPRANQTCCAEVRKPQSISNACNEKHIFVCQ